MNRSASATEKALAKLQQVIRKGPDGESIGMRMGQIPADLRGPDRVIQVALTGRAQLDAFEQVQWALRHDLRFEYLDDHANDDATWWFACAAHLQVKGLVTRFVAQYGHEPEHRTAYFPVELLSVPDVEYELGGARFIPLADADVPTPQFFPDPRPTMRSVIAADCVGTDQDLMRERARATALFALRLLRVALGDQFDQKQLRFRLGEMAWDDAHIRWDSAPDRGIELELTPEVRGMVAARDMSTVPVHSEDEIDRRVRLALQWVERGQLTVDPLVTLLFLFFAVEAILGDRAEGLKGHNLAIRRAMLGFLTTESESAAHPNVMFDLYERVRSAAVHGEHPPPLTDRQVRTFAWDVRSSLDQYVRLAREWDLHSRRDVVNALVGDERYERFVQRLRAEDPRRWKNVGE